VLVGLLESPSYEVKEQAIWALGNIAGDNYEFRDIIIQAGAVYPLIRIIEESVAEGTLLKNAIWALLNLCRGKPLPPYYAVRDTIPVFARVIMTQENTELLMDAALALSFLSGGSNEDDRNQRVLDTGVVPFLVRLLDDSFASLVAPCVKTIGNLLTGSNEQGNIVLEVPRIIEAIFRLLAHPKKALRREAAWVISIIAAGTPRHLEYLLQDAFYLNDIFKIILKEPSIEVRREAVWVLRNAVETADQRQLQILLLHRGIIQRMSVLLEKNGDQKIQEVIFRGLASILNRESFPEGYSRDVCVKILSSFGVAMKVIENLRNSQDNEIANLAQNILASQYDVQESNEKFF